jgi:hypothetical protein
VNKQALILAFDQTCLHEEDEEAAQAMKAGLPRLTPRKKRGRK